MHKADGEHVFLRVHSMVGLIPLLAVETIEPRTMEKLAGFCETAGVVSGQSAGAVQVRGVVDGGGKADRRLFSVVNAGPAAVAVDADAG